VNVSEGVLADNGVPDDDEHGVLLQTFRGFDLDAALSDPDVDPRWDLRAAATFLTDRMATMRFHSSGDPMGNGGDSFLADRRRQADSRPLRHHEAPMSAADSFARLANRCVAF